MVWRRVLVLDTCTLRELHGVIQVAMRWEGIHLYQFCLRSRRYGSWEVSASSPDVTRKHPPSTAVLGGCLRLINYGERFRAGERISSAMAESTVNAVVSKRFAKRQQMQWTRRGAHMLLQTRTRALDGTLRPLFERWYPGLANDNLAIAGRANAA